MNDMSDLVINYLIKERDKTKYLIGSVVDMEINYLFTNDYDYLNNFTTFIPKQTRQVQGGNQGQNDGNNKQQGINNNNMNNEIKRQPPIDAKTIFIKEIRNRIEAYFKLIVRNSKRN